MPTYEPITFVDGKYMLDGTELPHRIHLICELPNGGQVPVRFEWSGVATEKPTICAMGLPTENQVQYGQPRDIQDGERFARLREHRTS